MAVYPELCLPPKCDRCPSSLAKQAIRIAAAARKAKEMAAISERMKQSAARKEAHDAEKQARLKAERDSINMRINAKKLQTIQA